MAKFKGESNYLGAWSYAFLSLLYAIPVIGLIALFVHAYSENNENRRHFARSFFTRFLLSIIIIAVYFIILYFTLGQYYFAQRFSIITESIGLFFQSLFAF